MKEVRITDENERHQVMENGTTQMYECIHEEG